MNPRLKLGLKYLLWVLVLVPLWLGTGAMAAAGLYMLKQQYDVNIFSHTGFHSVMRCFTTEAQKIGNTPQTSGTALPTY